MNEKTIFLLGEYLTEQDLREGIPFSGNPGYALDKMLSIAGISRKDCHVSMVFNQPPFRGDLINFCGPKVEGVPNYPALIKGKFVKKEHAHELERLQRELEYQKPNIVIALGQAAAWAVLGTSGIRNIRGAPSLCNRLWNGKVIPTYSPGAVNRDWSLRPIVISDLDKAKRESAYPEIRKPLREIWVEPTIADLAIFEHQFISPSPDLSIDIETIGNQITCIGFAPSRDRCLVVPFYDPSRAECNYWPDLQTEMTAWNWVRRICGLRKRIVFQNGLYDIHFLWKSYGITCPHATNDTMLLHHALQPEMQKGLGFLGSLYTDEASWKFMRKKHETLKKED